MVVVAVDVLPAASLAMIVIRLLPLRSCKLETDQVALSVVPRKLAVPDPPRLLVHRTRYRRVLSVTVPCNWTTPVALGCDCDVILTTGAMPSSERERAS